jgi:hypothetical protein
MAKQLAFRRLKNFAFRLDVHEIKDSACRGNMGTWPRFAEVHAGKSRAPRLLTA